MSTPKYSTTFWNSPFKNQNSKIQKIQQSIEKHNSSRTGTTLPRVYSDSAFKPFPSSCLSILTYSHSRSAKILLAENQEAKDAGYCGCDNSWHRHCIQFTLTTLLFFRASKIQWPDQLRIIPWNFNRHSVSGTNLHIRVVHCNAFNRVQIKRSKRVDHSQRRFETTIRDLHITTELFQFQNNEKMEHMTKFSEGGKRSTTSDSKKVRPELKNCCTTQKFWKFHHHGEKMKLWIRRVCRIWFLVLRTQIEYCDTREDHRCVKLQTAQTDDEQLPRRHPSLARLLNAGTDLS